MLVEKYCDGWSGRTVMMCAGKAGKVDIFADKTERGRNTQTGRQTHRASLSKIKYFTIAIIFCFSTGFFLGGHHSVVWLKKFQPSRGRAKILDMALPHTMDEEEGEGDDLDLQPAVPEDVQAVMVAAEEGNASALSRALGEKIFKNQSCFWLCNSHLRS